MSNLQEITESRLVVRDYEPRDLEALKRIHAATGIDYRFPDLASPLWIVTKVAEWDGEVRAGIGGYIQIEAYLWLDPSDWADPQTKFDLIHQLDISGMLEAHMQGIDCAVLWLPPNMERFGDRLKMLGWEKDRDGWQTYSKATRK